MAIKEIVVETYLKDQIELLGGICEKHTAPGRRGVPDRLITLPGLSMELVETKRPKGGRLSPGQKRDHRERAKRGIFVHVLWTLEQVDEYIRQKRNQLNALNL